MILKEIAYFHSPFTSKFGVPKQSGLVDELAYRSAEQTLHSKTCLALLCIFLF